MSENSYNPGQKEQEILREVFSRYGEMRKARDKKYRLLGDRTPQKYWDECEKRFTSFAPPKEITEDDWQANVVMGITRNAVLSQVSKAGMRTPQARFRSFSKEGFTDDVRSKIYGHLYEWSLAREQADRKQQFISLGNYVRGNACVYEGWEDTEKEVEKIIDTDIETGEIRSEKKKIRKFGPKRQIVPLDEIFFPNYFLTDIQDQTDLIWRRVMQMKDAEAEFGGMKNWKNVKGGYYAVGPSDEPFFRSSQSLTGKQVEVIRHFVSVKGIGKTKDRFRIVAGGVLLLDIPLQFNHKRLPFAWCLNEPLADSFMLGLSIPMKVMQEQDTADSLWNMLLDKSTLSILKPTMTDDPDPNIRTFLSPGGIMQFSPGSKWSLAPIEGVNQSEFQMLQEALKHAKEDSGSFGGASGFGARGGKITARQAVMMEEESKRILGISMANLEMLERDIAAQRIQNIMQFSAGTGEKMEAKDVELSDGRRGRFVAYLPKSEKEGQEKRKELSMIEMIGEILGQPTEAVSLTPKFFDQDDRIESETIPESSYLKNKSLEQAMELENFKTLSGLPNMDIEELERDLLKILGKDPQRLIKRSSSASAESSQGMSQHQSAPGSLNAQISGKGQEKSLSQVMGM